MAVGINNFQVMMQTYFPDRDLPWLIPENLPWLNAVPKMGNLSGDVIDHPFLLSPRRGYSQQFDVAMKLAGTAPRGARAALRCSQAYSAMEIFDKDEALSQGEASYGSLEAKTMEGSIKDFNNNLDLDLHGGGNGWRGTVVAVAGSPNPNGGPNLTVGQVAIARGMPFEAVFDLDQLVEGVTYAGFPVAGTIFPPSDGRAATTISTPVQITACDGTYNVLTLTDASQFPVGTFVTLAGGSTGFSTSNLEGNFVGIDAWIPYGGVSANDQFLGLNRASYGTKIAGYSMDGTRFSAEEGIKRLAARMSQGGATGGQNAMVLINALDWDAIDSKLATYARYSSFDTATFGFKSIVINSAIGELHMVADPHQPQGYARIMTPSTWLLYHKYALPHVVDVQGRTMEQGLNFDGRTARLRAYAQQVCFEPRKNGIIKLPQTIVG